MTPETQGWTRGIVFDRLCEAAETLRRLPDAERRFLNPNGNGAWPEILRLAADRFAAAVARGGYDPIAVRLDPPPPAWIDRLGEVMGWLGWVPAGELRILWALSSGVRVERLRRRIGCHRNTIRGNKHRALRRIVAELEARRVPLTVAERTLDQSRLTDCAEGAESRTMIA